MLHGPVTRAAVVAAVLLALPFGTSAQAQAHAPKIVPWPQGHSLPFASNHLTYYGGPVMPFAKNVLVLWGTHTTASANALNNMLTDMAAAGNANPYNVAGEYGTLGLPAPTSSQPLTVDSDYSGSAVTISPTKCSSTSTCMLQDSDITTELNAQITAGNLPAPVQAFGGPVTYYSVLFPSNVQICMPNNTCSGVQFCAYHETAYHGPGSTNPFMYGVIPDGPSTSGNSGCGPGTALANLESYFSHELTEAITDPEVGFVTNVGPPLGWYENTQGGGEIGDICNGQETPATINGHSYTVQKEWSNSGSACVSTESRTLPTPNATFSASGLTRNFDASSSTPGAGSITSYLWDFGDGSSVVSGATPSHQFPGVGTYEVNLITTNSGHSSARKKLQVTITPAHLTVAKTADSQTVTAGSQAGFTVTLGNTGDATVSGVALTDKLPAATGVSWVIADQSGGWSISGAAPNQSLVAPSTIAGGVSSHAHVTSATTNSSCGTLNNNASATSTNGGSGDASASITVSGCVAPPPDCVVPRVVGAKLSVAKTAIGKAHCSVGKITRKHAAKSKRGKVIAQSPKSGEKLKNDAKVNLTVGK